MMAEKWGTGRAYASFIQHPPDAEEAARFLAQFERSACTPQMASEIMRRNVEIDVCSILSTISVPTLVMHCMHDPLVPVVVGRYLAEHIPQAQYFELDADFHVSWDRDEMAMIRLLLSSSSARSAFRSPGHLLDGFSSRSSSRTSRARQNVRPRWETARGASCSTGEIMVSRTVKELVTGSGIALLDRGTHTVKGVPDGWQLFAVEP